MLSDAAPVEETVTVPRGVEPSENVTLPAETVPPADVTDAVKVTEAPCGTVAAEVLSDVEVDEGVAEALGPGNEPRPVGPSHPGPASQTAVPQDPLLPVTTSYHAVPDPQTHAGARAEVE